MVPELSQERETPYPVTGNVIFSPISQVLLLFHSIVKLETGKRIRDNCENQSNDISPNSL